MDEERRWKEMCMHLSINKYLHFTKTANHAKYADWMDDCISTIKKNEQPYSHCRWSATRFSCRSDLNWLRKENSMGFLGQQLITTDINCVCSFDAWFLPWSSALIAEIPFGHQKIQIFTRDKIDFWGWGPYFRLLHLRMSKNIKIP